MTDKLKLPNKCIDFESVQKELIQIEQSINGLLERSTEEAEFATAEGTDGQSGDTKIVRNPDKTYTFLIKTQDGWKTPVWEGREVQFQNKPKKEIIESQTLEQIEAEDTSKGTNKLNNTVIEPSSGKFMLARPDYESDWIDVSSSPTSSGTLTHNLEVYPKLATAWFAPDADYNSGDPTKLFLLNLDVGMRHQDSWTGISTLFTKTTMQYYLYTKIYTTYGVYNDPMANGWDKFTDGYMKVFLWK